MENHSEIKARYPRHYKRFLRMGALVQEKRGKADTLHVRTQTEVARMLGMSRQCVRQTEKIAIGKIRRALMPHLLEMNRDLYERLNQIISEKSCA